jgi:hypothetical protein
MRDSTRPTRLGHVRDECEDFGWTVLETGRRSCQPGEARGSARGGAPCLPDDPDVASDVEQARPAKLGRLFPGPYIRSVCQSTHYNGQGGQIWDGPVERSRQVPLHCSCGWPLKPPNLLRRRIPSASSATKRPDITHSARHLKVRTNDIASGSVACQLELTARRF